MIMEWLRKRAALTLEDERPGDSKEVGELRDEVRLLDRVVDQQQSMIADLTNQLKRHQKTENEAEEIVESLRADLEVEKAQAEKWKRWGEKAVEKIITYERIMNEETKKVWDQLCWILTAELNDERMEHQKS